MIEAIGIDVDDTLCLTEAACFDMENEVLQAMGRQPMDRDVHFQTWGKPLFEVISVRSPGIDVEAFKAVFEPTMADFLETGRLDTIPPENYEALDRLIEMGKTLFILTSRTHIELRHMLEPDHLLAERVKAYYYRDTMDFHKPDPRAFDAFLRDSALRPEQCLYVGDSLGDATSAIERGLHFVASLESGLRTQEDFAHMPVDGFIDRFPDIVDEVARLDAIA